MSASNFCLNLYKKLIEEEKEKNIFFSPYNISLAMSMVLFGTSETSKDQLIKGLGFEDIIQLTEEVLKLKLNQASSNSLLTTANSIFPEKTLSLKKNFCNQLKEKFDAEIKSLDYKNSPEKSRMEINNWVEEKTNGKIKEVLQQGVVTRLTKLILTSAIYFKGKWKDQFEKSATKAGHFYCQDKKVCNVKMMQKEKSFLCNYDEKLKLQCLQLPYKDNEVSMCIFLPDERYGVDDLHSNITVDQMNKMLDDCKSEKVHLKLPKFVLKYEQDLVKSFKSLGVTDLFDCTKESLKEICDENDLFISNIIHKSFVEVDEEGTEAAAATVVAISRMAFFPPIQFNCDHPFWFLIRHNSSKTILFFGKVASLN